MTTDPNGNPVEINRRLIAQTYLLQLMEKIRKRKFTGKVEINFLDGEPNENHSLITQPIKKYLTIE